MCDASSVTSESVWQALCSQQPQNIKPCPGRGRTAAASALQATALHEQASSSGREELAPWLLGFQCNERYLQWDDSAQVRLRVARHAQHKPRAVWTNCMQGP